MKENIIRIWPSDFETGKQISKEEIERIVEDKGYWKGVSHEYMISSWIDYEINKENGKYLAKAYWDDNYSLSMGNLNSFNDVYMVLSLLSETLIKIGNNIEVIEKNIKRKI